MAEDMLKISGGTATKGTEPVGIGHASLLSRQHIHAGRNIESSKAEHIQIYIIGQAVQVVDGVVPPYFLVPQQLYIGADYPIFAIVRLEAVKGMRCCKGGVQVVYGSGKLLL
jgi:hypothetical protein